eukprot:TRINITY_DN3530_c0_g1_i1.p1 TRINITY_DN3530_c0_g1~~TRINITY_DN3530_c0_g1_i1.p1  ORF type:complete len:407 (-),score=102.10 TRINITY_DN3530_c0_g1_i1:164-1384(-)
MEVEILNSFQKLTALAKKGLDSVHYFVAGCSTREKSEYSNALQVIGKLIADLRGAKESMEGSPIGGLTTKFCTDFESAMLSTLGLGKNFLKKEVSYSDFMTGTDELKEEMEMLIEQCNASVMEKLASGGMDENVRNRSISRRRTITRGASIKDTFRNDGNRTVYFENFMKLRSLIKLEQKKNEDWSNQLHSIKEQYMKEKHGLNDEEDRLTKKKNEILEFRVVFEKIIAAEKKTKQKIAQYDEKVSLLTERLAHLKNKLSSAPSTDEIVQLRSEIEKLEKENDDLKGKISILEKDLSDAISQANRLVQNATAELRRSKTNDEVVTLQRDLNILYSQVDFFQIQIREQIAQEREFEELAHELNQKLKEVFQEMQDKSTSAPENLLEEFEKLYEETEELWASFDELLV